MQAIKAVTGVTPTCWRPPFGDVDVRPVLFIVSYDTFESADSLDVYFVGPYPLYRKRAWSPDYYLEVRLE